MKSVMGDGEEEPSHTVAVQWQTSSRHATMSHPEPSPRDEARIPTLRVDVSYTRASVSVGTWKQQKVSRRHIVTG